MIVNSLNVATVNTVYLNNFNIMRAYTSFKILSCILFRNNIICTSDRTSLSSTFLLNTFWTERNHDRKTHLRAEQNEQLDFKVSWIQSFCSHDSSRRTQSAAKFHWWAWYEPHVPRRNIRFSQRWAFKSSFPVPASCIRGKSGFYLTAAARTTHRGD